ncbi:hypothetical protein AB835_09155 [Candidatus Endobugula sertula]|uniref:Uncharacterized protein n=1 Tax=Candidatus Endobugula sertula TaxID=62101 RepID=A0A1D2QP69_9GAMM|nr:hypothetical protein AB835_09155 [Candidatus Endobugula sertula]
MSKKYNLWILNHYSGNLRNGMEYRHFFLAKHLRRLGHRVSIVASTYSHLFSMPPSTTRLVEHEEIDGVEFVWLKVPRYENNGVKRLINMLSYSCSAQFFNLQKYIGRPDAILGSSPHPFCLLNTLQLAKRFNVPSVAEIRDLWPLMLVELGSIKPNHPLCKVFQSIENKAFREANRIISLWHTADRYMLNHGVSAERYRYLPNGIELEDKIYKGQHPLLDAVVQQKAAGRFVAGYGGSHGHANPLQQVIDGCHILQQESVDDIAFFMVGDGPDKADAVTKAKQLGLKNMYWFDSVPKDVIMAFYQELNCTFIGLKDLPLFKYGPTPNKLMDYLAASKPIIYAIRSSFNPVREHKLGLSIEPDDGQILAQALKQMRDISPDERLLMGQRARDFAEKEHSYKALSKRLDDIILELL